MRRVVIALGVVLVVMAALSVIQHLQLSNSPDPEIMKEVGAVYKSQQPVRLVCKLVDQFGKPAVHYTFKVELRSYRWYYWIYPWWAHSESQCLLQTNAEGVAKLDWKLKRAYLIQFTEVAITPYQFSRARSPFSPKTLEDDPTHSFPLPSLIEGHQVIHLNVLSNHPPEKPMRYEPTYPERNDGIVFDAADKSQFTLNLLENRFEYGVASGDVLLTITNAKAVGEAYWKNRAHEESWTDRPTWQLRLDGLRGAVLLPLGDQFIADAPPEGYFSSLIFKQTFDAVVPVSPMLNLKPSEWVGSVPVFTVDEVGAGCLQRMVVCTGDPRYYGYLEIGVDIDRKGKILLRPRAFFNPDGTPNL